MITILGAGVAGLCAATVLAERGLSVEVVDSGPEGAGASWLAGGMLAPFVEAESAPPEVARLGATAAEWWAARVPGVVRHGTLVVAPARDRAELDRFATRTTGYARIGADRIAELEPALAGRFANALLYEAEAHLDPRVALQALADGLRQRRVAIRYDTHLAPDQANIDCRGIAARDTLLGLRAVRGEMLLLHCPNVTLTRPIRLLHPRFPVYVVPREGGRFMVGATMVESDAVGPVTLRSASELMSAAFALHPGFAEAAIVEMGSGLRPAFADNVPRLTQAAGRWHLNGLYRHGFLTAPALAKQLADEIDLAPQEAAFAH
ncbi:FAD-dependent oxidoreductase [Rhodobacteraceae bacterium HSP-20]|uniref:FAD-dependent oxidoreductase n=1 Tax=Paragemmobacter amnigenus TaxID=2852097 RepID=A0ABS6J8N4_9RHOB|nr:FAD-dependent oxidoreductase [Rhodobacter amnigenus]MBU9698832.1 FAD-dependent oxidoreductase [Rhodobacter amnigenus]MBV4390059.1 FAD-dependent oxidoreductase [Rhodobacter amnigenus]